MLGVHEQEGILSIDLCYSEVNVLFFISMLLEN